MFRRRLACQYIIGNAVDFRDMPGDGATDLHKALEFADCLVVFHGYCPDFYNPVSLGRLKPGCFDVNKDNSLFVQRPASFLTKF